MKIRNPFYNYILNEINKRFITHRLYLKSTIMVDEELLVVDFPHLEEALQLLNGNESNFFDYLSSTSSTDVKMEGLDTISPTCRMGRFEFSGTYEYSLGSRMYFTVDNSESEEKEQITRM